MNNTHHDNDLAELYTETGACLNRQLLHMTTYTYEKSVKKLSPNKQEQAAILFFDVKDRRDKWLNQTLEGILDDLEKDKDELQKGINEVEKTKQLIDKTEQYLNALADLIGIVTKIMGIVGVVN